MLQASGDFRPMKASATRVKYQQFCRKHTSNLHKYTETTTKKHQVSKYHVRISAYLISIIYIYILIYPYNLHTSLQKKNNDLLRGGRTGRGLRQMEMKITTSRRRRNAEALIESSGTRKYECVSIVYIYIYKLISILCFLSYVGCLIYMYIYIIRNYTKSTTHHF